jgi:hypothetical protein
VVLGRVTGQTCKSENLRLLLSLERCSGFFLMLINKAKSMLPASLRRVQSSLWERAWSVLLLAFLFASPAQVVAQTLTVQNGGTLQVDNGGIWDLNGSNVDLGPVGSTASIAENGTARFAGGTLEATRDLSSPSQADPAGLGIEISAGEDLGATTITRGHAVQNAPNGNEGIARYYDISPAQNNSGLSATLTLTYRDDELNGLSESNLEFFKSTDGGNTWSEEGQNGRDPNANAVTLGGIESFSRWTLGSTQSPLPVELAGFDAAATEGDVRLTWQTASETNNAGFEVQRQKEKNGWTQVGYVESKASGGTTTETKSYQYTAKNLPVGTHRFRLKQVDLDGSSTPFDPLSVEVQMREAVILNAPAPNPVSSSAILSFAVKEPAETTIRLYNTLGQQVRAIYEGTPQAGERQRAQVDVSDLSSGTYFLRLSADGQTQTQRLTVVR